MRGKIVVLTASLFSAGLCLGDCPSADLTGNCFVDYEDLALMSAAWLWAQGRNPADLNHDLIIDFNDFAVMAVQWRTGEPRVPDDMVSIPGGTFQMGDSFSEGNLEERPVHTVTLDSFYMGSCEVTNGQYCDFLNSAIGSTIYVSDGFVYGSENSRGYCDTSTSSSNSQIAYSRSGIFSVRTKNGRDMSNDPMMQVSWHGAVAYCNWRSQQEGRQPCYDLLMWSCDFDKHGYRLATEAEWEYAARGGLSGKRFPWGDIISHSQANYQACPSCYTYDAGPTQGFHPDWDDVWPYTSPGGSFSANGYGLYDMAGNVAEWCNDWYLDGYYSSSPSNNPTGPLTGWFRVYRDGAWNGSAWQCRVAYRNGLGPSSRSNYMGFRLALDFN